MTREELNRSMQKKIEWEAGRDARRKKTFNIIKYILCVLFIFVAISIYVYTFSIHGYVVNEKRIVDSAIPDSFNGAKIIQISDLHYGSSINNDELDKVIDLINSRNPDIVVFTGDLIAKNYKMSKKNEEKFINKLAKIKTNYGKYAVVGDEDSDNYITIISQADFLVLNNETELVYNNSDRPISITGIASEEINKENIDSNLFNIAISHKPDLLSSLIDTGAINLAFAGHSHNGNIRIPFMEPIINGNGAKKINKRYSVINNSHTFVSSGIGTYGIRLFCRPSINFIRLSSK